jgi:hypothetical protein
MPCSGGPARTTTARCATARRRLPAGCCSAVRCDPCTSFKSASSTHSPVGSASSVFSGRAAAGMVRCHAPTHLNNSLAAARRNSRQLSSYVIPGVRQRVLRGPPAGRRAPGGALPPLPGAGPGPPQAGAFGTSALLKVAASTRLEACAGRYVSWQPELGVRTLVATRLSLAITCSQGPWLPRGDCDQAPGRCLP